MLGLLTGAFSSGRTSDGPPRCHRQRLVLRSTHEAVLAAGCSGRVDVALLNAEVTDEALACGWPDVCASGLLKPISPARTRGRSRRRLREARRRARQARSSCGSHRGHRRRSASSPRDQWWSGSIFAVLPTPVSVVEALVRPPQPFPASSRSAVSRRPHRPFVADRFARRGPRGSTGTCWVNDSARSRSKNSNAAA